MRCDGDEEAKFFFPSQLNISPPAHSTQQCGGEEGKKGNKKNFSDFLRIGNFISFLSVIFDLFVSPCFRSV